MRTHIATAACVMMAFALSMPARGDFIVGPVQDFKGSVHIDPGIPNIPKDTNFHVGPTGAIFIDLADIFIIAHSPGFIGDPNFLGIAYVASQTPSFDTGDLMITTIYGIDLNPTGSDLQMTGVNETESFSVTEETIIGHSGTNYPASSGGVVSIFDLPHFLGAGYNLAPFAQGEPLSFVFVFQTFVPASDAITAVPEPSSWVMVVIGGLVTLGRGLRRRGR